MSLGDEFLLDFHKDGLTLSQAGRSDVQLFLFLLACLLPLPLFSAQGIPSSLELPVAQFAIAVKPR